VADGEADACGSSLREHPVNTGEVDIRTAAASIKGSDLPCGLTSNFIVDNPRARPEAEVSVANRNLARSDSALARLEFDYRIFPVHPDSGIPQPRSRWILSIFETAVLSEE
jgi:hypothetical protein